jgi:hypothetical protein
MEATIRDLNEDSVGEIESWLDEPSLAVFTFVFWKKAYGRLKHGFDAVCQYRPAFVQLYITFVKKDLYSYGAKVGNLELLKWARLGQSNGMECSWDADKFWTCELAARGGHLEVLKWARLCQGSNMECPWDEFHWDANTCAAAASGGHLEVLKWARLGQGPNENGCPWDKNTEDIA